jgi:uncharacterized damage-inducible protein DinB
METALVPLANIFELNTDLLLNCLDGLTDAEAQRRLDGGGNSVVFLAAHLTDSRHFLVARLGHPLANPLAPVLAEAGGIDDIPAWPPLAEIRNAWAAVSEHLVATLGSVSAEELARPNAHRFPLSDSTQLGLVAFLAQHDSYHVGQTAFLRRQLGKPAMAYTRRPGAVPPVGAAGVSGDPCAAST